MQYILAGLIRFIMSGLLALFGGAAAVLVLGYFLQVNESEQEAHKAAALAAGPPAVVNIEKYDRDTHRTEMGEVNLRGQLDFSTDYELTLEDGSTTHRALMVPLMGADTGEPIGVALYTTDSFQFADMDPMALLAKTQGFGEVGPILHLNGEISSIGKWDEIVRDSFSEHGRTLPPNMLVVYPYVEGRAVAFAPKTGASIFGIFSKIAGVIALLGILKLVFRTSDPVAQATPDLPPIQTQNGPQTASGFSALDDPFALTGSARRGMREETQADPLAVTPATATPAPIAAVVPDWKRRLDAKLNGDAIEHDPSHGLRAGMLGKPEPKGRSFGSVLRKIAVFVVGGAFVLVLIATIGSLMMEAKQNDAVAAIPTVEEQLAQVMAEVVVPETAPSDKAWYEFDFAPVAQWFVAKGLLAVAGDRNAQITLGAIVGALFVFIIMLGGFFMLRGMFRPRIQPSLTGMGMDSP
ncbi:MAG: hypothetical protein QNL92_01875 [Octadecabacter sp.]